MTYTDTFLEVEPTRDAIDAAKGWQLVEFGVPWCPHCQRAQPAIAAAFAGRTGIAHLKVEDGRGRPLGRSFAVKLWPTLVLVQDGVERGRLVRPTDAAELVELLNGQGTS